MRMWGNEKAPRGRREVKNMNIEYPRGVDSAKVIQVIETKAAKGNGTLEQPSRIVTQYWSLGGELLAEKDSIRDERPVDVQ